eukprot:5650408-Pleurochrysis_carterae.AAC.1
MGEGGQVGTATIAWEVGNCRVVGTVMTLVMVLVLVLIVMMLLIRRCADRGEKMADPCCSEQAMPVLSRAVARATSVASSVAFAHVCHTGATPTSRRIPTRSLARAAA